MTEAKVLAAREHHKLGELMAEPVRAGLETRAGWRHPARQRRNVAGGLATP